MKIEHFIPNELDNLHCLQACIRMILFQVSGTEPTLTESEEFTGYVAGQQTWPYTALLNFSKSAYEVVDIELTDHQLFAADPKNAIVTLYGNKIWEHIVQNSDVAAAQLAAAMCVEDSNISFRKEAPKLDTIRQLLVDNYYVICNVNSKVLIDEDGYNGHFVIVESVNEDVAMLQNPGLPAFEHQIVSVDKFEKAWAYPSHEATNIIAVRTK